MNNQTIKNGPADISDETKIELEKRLRSIWLGMRIWNQTIKADLSGAKSRNLEDGAKQIRQLLDDQPNGYG